VAAFEHVDEGHGTLAQGNDIRAGQDLTFCLGFCAMTLTAVQPHRLQSPVSSAAIAAGIVRGLQDALYQDSVSSFPIKHQDLAPIGFEHDQIGCDFGFEFV
jgi:hypothetical protein